MCVCVQAGTYLPQSYLVQEEMMVTERLHHVEQLGSFISNLCEGRETFKLQRRDTILGTLLLSSLGVRGRILDLLRPELRDPGDSQAPQTQSCRSEEEPVQVQVQNGSVEQLRPGSGSW